MSANFKQAATPPAAGPVSIWQSIDTQVKYDGKAIVLPGDPQNMDLDSAIATLERMKLMENQRYDVHELIEGAPWDAVVAIAKAMHAIYGVVVAQSIQTFFGEIKPVLVTIKTGHGPNDNVQVATGNMSLPNMDKPVNIGMYNGGAYIQGTVRRKDRQALVDIANRARFFMRTESIYKGKAIHFRVSEDGELQLNEQPEFIDLTKVEVTDMIHTSKTHRMIRNNIFSPLKNTAACRKHQIPLKRGILLHGRYGTGKSLTARVTAKVAQDNGWTFVMLDKSQGLRAAIEFARTYQPCVIFAEDIDRCADREDESVNTLVNTLDGLISKDMEIMTVLTTNFIKKIDIALLRPGRFDAVIEILPPDSETAGRLIHHYGRELLIPSIDLTAVGDLIAGQIPATIREVVERAKLMMLEEDRSYLTSDDLVDTAETMLDHMKLLDPPPEDNTPAQKFYDAFATMVRDAANIDEDIVDGLKGDMNSVKRNQTNLAHVVNKKVGEAAMHAAAAAGSAEKSSEFSQQALETGKKTLDVAKKTLNAING